MGGGGGKLGSCEAVTSSIVVVLRLELLQDKTVGWVVVSNIFHFHLYFGN